MNFTHDELTIIAEKWLLSRCGFAFRELTTFAGETPDAIGYRSGSTILVECKASRADFLSDKKKFFRRNPEQGVGSFRFFLCPQDLIKPEELPIKWGLLYVNDKGKVRKKVGSKGNTFSYPDEFFFSERNRRNEAAMMYSALRRLQLQGVFPLIYDKFRKNDTPCRCYSFYNNQNAYIFCPYCGRKL